MDRRRGKRYEWAFDILLFTAVLLSQSLVITTVNPRAGRLLIFDQALVHEGIPPCDPNFKFIIRSDIMYQRTPSICDSSTDIEAYRLFKEAEQLAEAGRVEESIPLFRRAVKMSRELAAIMGH
jgi:hypothetical protein